MKKQNEAVSVHSSSSESPTILSTEQPEEDDAHMEDDDSANTSSADEDDCLSNRPAPSEAYPTHDEMLEMSREHATPTERRTSKQQPHVVLL